nr:uncharacterized protein LOC107453111 [Parasteatoda tepidariorum]
MLINNFTLPDLVDLALKVPELGVVNFNILHTVLQAMISELGLTNSRPWCNIQSPLNAAAALTQAKLKGDVRRSSVTGSSMTEKHDEQTESRRSVSSEANISVSLESKETQTNLISEKEETERIKKEVKTEEEETPESTQDQEIEKTEAKDLTPDLKSEPRPEETGLKEKSPKKREDLKLARVALESAQQQVRLEQTEEGLMRLNETVDWLVDKIKKNEARRPGGPSSAEIEALEDRVFDLEEGREIWDNDHILLLEVEEIVNQMQKEFEVIKALGNDLEIVLLEVEEIVNQMQKEFEVIKALGNDLEKADITLVNTKVDQVEFETAFEELGEAIGLLGIKFQKKNDEWEVRAAELWDAVNSKMTRDVFESARIKIEERLTALMYGLKTLKQVVEELLYPDSGGVTRCITCRRPADIAGHSKFLSLFQNANLELLAKRLEQHFAKFKWLSRHDVIICLSNDEWEVRAAELWDAVNSKMTRDVFESARIKIEERLTALMYGLKTLKQVVEELLYPDSGGVTRCITCRRPADIAGHVCINLSMSPKRPFQSSKDSSFEDKEKVPYSSPTYRSATDNTDIQSRMKMYLAPINRTSKKEKMFTPIPKPESNSNQRDIYFTNLK